MKAEPSFLLPKFMPYSSSYIDEMMGVSKEYEDFDDDDSANECDKDIAFTKQLKAPEVSGTNAALFVTAQLIASTSCGSKRHIIGLNKSEVFYISGFCYITLLKGKLSINGYSAVIGNKVRINNPVWQPAYRAYASGSQQKKQQSNTKKAISQLFGSQNELFKNGCTEFLLDDSTQSCFLLEEVNSSDQSWLIAAEDQSVFNSKSINERQCIGKSKKSRQEFLSQLSASSGASPESPFLTCSRSVVGVDSAVIGSLEHITSLGIDVTNMPASWVAGCESVVSSLAKRDNARSVVCGAKGVGKSSCMRHLVNSLLSLSSVDAVCVIDCDLGQPELTVSGVISLHVLRAPLLSASHLSIHQSKPEISFYFGDITSRHEPEALITCLRELVQRYHTLADQCAEQNASQSTKLVKKSDINNFNALLMLPKNGSGQNDEEEAASLKPTRLIPLVVNTDGFVRYMGAEVLVAVMDCVKPSHVLHISTEKDRALPALDKFFAADSTCSVSTLEPGRVTSAKVTAVDLRALRMVSYFLGRDGSLRDKVRAQLTNEGDASSTISLRDVDSSSGRLGNGGIYVRNATLVDPEGYLALALLRTSPLIVPFESATIHSAARDLSPNLLLASLNASLVGLAVPHTRSISGSELNVSKHRLKGSDGGEVEVDTSIGSPVSAGRCVGLAIIRAVDVHHQHFVVTTPVDEGDLLVSEEEDHHCVQDPRVVVMRGTSGQQLPNVLLFATGLPCYPYLSSESAGEGSAKMKARNNVKRRSQQK